MSPIEAGLCEVFNSFQGEGLYLGARQTFIRFAGCNLSCQYCDSLQALTVPKEWKAEVSPGGRKFEKFPNPAALPQLVDLVKAFERPRGINHSISLTGGEPLLQVDFLKQLIPELKKETGLPIYLETNGVLPDHLSEIIDLVDIVAMDIKLPSATGLSPYWKEHKKALETAYLKEVFVKAVFSRETKVMEMDEAASLIAEVDENIPLVLQPVSHKNMPAPEQIFSLHAVSKRKLKNVRVIPQVHKIFGAL